MFYVRRWRKGHRHHPGSNNEFEIQLRVILPSGEKHEERKKFVGTKTEAKFWAQERERELLRGMPATPAQAPSTETGAPTFEGFEKEFMNYSEANNKPSAVEAKRTIIEVHLREAFGAVRLDRINSASVDTYKTAKLKTGLTAKTINNHLAVLRAALNLAEERGIIDRAPKVRAYSIMKKEAEYLTFDEADRLIEVTPPPWLVMVLFVLRTGLRMGEVLAVKWEDIDLVARRLHVRRSMWRGKEGSPKGGRSRVIGLSRKTAAALSGYRHLKGPYVFCDEKGQPLTHKKLSSLVPTLCKRAGLAKRLTFHGLRHTFASHLVMRGVPLAAVKDLLGHATIDMTMRYAHLSPDLKNDAVNLLDGDRETGEIREKEKE